MSLNTKRRFLISPELGNQFILISILTPCRAAVPVPARLSPHAPNPCDHDSKPNDESVDHDASRAPHFTRNAARMDAMKTLTLR
jgi:hypothetical protein